MRLISSASVCLAKGGRLCRKERPQKVLAEVLLETCPALRFSLPTPAYGTLKQPMSRERGGEGVSATSVAACTARRVSESQGVKGRLTTRYSSAHERMDQCACSRGNLQPGTLIRFCVSSHFFSPQQEGQAPAYAASVLLGLDKGPGG